MAEEKISRPKVQKTKRTPSKRSALSIDVYGVNGAVEKTLELPKEIFSVEASPKLLAQYVRVYLANQRQGTSATKTRGEVRGSTKKIYRQKGTGRARHGARKAPIFVGGGVAFGPHPRDYSLKMNKKQRRKALFYALSLKAKDKSIVGLSKEALTMEPKTKLAAHLFKTMGIEGKMLLVMPEMKNNLYRAARNLPKVNVVSAHGINPYIVMNTKRIIFSENALVSLSEHFLQKHEK